MISTYLLKLCFSRLEYFGYAFLSIFLKVGSDMMKHCIRRGKKERLDLFISMGICDLGIGNYRSERRNRSIPFLVMRCVMKH